jgi:hypothetical protein
LVYIRFLKCARLVIVLLWRLGLLTGGLLERAILHVVVDGPTCETGLGVWADCVSVHGTYIYISRTNMEIEGVCHRQAVSVALIIGSDGGPMIHGITALHKHAVVRQMLVEVRVHGHE